MAASPSSFRLSPFTFRLVFDPRMDPIACAVAPVFPFPDGHDFLQSIDKPLAGGEGVGPMRRTHRHRNARVAKFQTPQPMDDCTSDERPPLASLRLKLGELFFGHFRIAF